MRPRTSLSTTLPDGGHLARAIHVRQGVGVAAHVLQGRELEILRIRVEQPALILVDRGIKTVRTERGVRVRALPGQAIILDANQTVDFTNSVTDGAHYEARWLLFDRPLLDDPYYLDRAAHAAAVGQSPARLLSQVGENLAVAFESARQALASGARIPDAVVRQRMLEVMHWLLEEGVVLPNPPANPGVSVKVRTLVAGSLDGDWTAGRVAGELALSEATLRRRLAAEKTSLTELLTDARMATALTLLQATTQPVADIALSVGYESPSRFAVRFRQRFGFAPTAVRGHERTDPPTTTRPVP
jgi:AraC-like DNA-binding protein